MRYISYLRVSSPNQNIEFQRGIIEKWLEGDPVTYFEDIGKSGALPISKRPGLVAALNELKSGDCFLVYSSCRFARDVKIAKEVRARVKLAGAELVSILDEEMMPELISDIKELFGEDGVAKLNKLMKQ